MRRERLRSLKFLGAVGGPEVGRKADGRQQTESLAIGSGGSYSEAEHRDDAEAEVAIGGVEGGRRKRRGLVGNRHSKGSGGTALWPPKRCVAWTYPGDPSLRSG